MKFSNRKNKQTRWLRAFSDAHDLPVSAICRPEFPGQGWVIFTRFNGRDIPEYPADFRAAQLALGQMAANRAAYPALFETQEVLVG